MDLITERLKLKDAFPDVFGSIVQKYGLADDAEFVRKGLVPEGMEFNDGEQSVVSIITTGAQDRDHEIVDPAGCMFADWNQNPVVLWCHDYRQLPLGRGMITMSNGKIIGKTFYAKHEFAQKVFEYRKGGFPLAQSIGFIPTQTTYYQEGSDEAKEGISRKFDQWILLEYSDVPVPANPEAVTIAVSKGLLPGIVQAVQVTPEIAPVPESDPVVKSAVFMVKKPHVQQVSFDVKAGAEILRGLLRARDEQVIRAQGPQLLKDTIAVLKGRV